MRGPREDDFSAFAAFYQGPRCKHVGGPLSRELAWRNFASLWGHWVLRGYGRWTVEEVQTGTAVGNIGLWYPLGWPEPEIGWTLFDGAQGKGYATEAANAVKEYAYETLGWSTLISAIAPDNIESVALAKRLGAHLDGSFEHERFGRLDVWRHPGPESEKIS